MTLTVWPSVLPLVLKACTCVRNCVRYSHRISPYQVSSLGGIPLAENFPVEPYGLLILSQICDSKRRQVSTCTPVASQRRRSMGQFPLIEPKIDLTRLARATQCRARHATAFSARPGNCHSSNCSLLCSSSALGPWSNRIVGRLLWSIQLT